VGAGLLDAAEVAKIGGQLLKRFMNICIESTDWLRNIDYRYSDETLSYNRIANRLVV